MSENFAVMAHWAEAHASFVPRYLLKYAVPNTFTIETKTNSKLSRRLEASPLASLVIIAGQIRINNEIPLQILPRA